MRIYEANGDSRPAGWSRSRRRFGRLAAAVALGWSGLLAGAAQSADLFASGPVSGQVTWSGTVRVTGDVTVPAGTTLTIEPGTQILVEPNGDDQIAGANPSRVELIVDSGQLMAVGTEANPIRITSAGGTPAKGDWAGLVLKLAQVRLRYCVVEYAQKALSVTGGDAGTLDSPAIANCIFQHSQAAGVELNSSYTLADCTVEDNARGVDVTQGGSNVTLVRCTVQNNAQEGIATVGNSALNLNGTKCLRNKTQGVFSGGTLTAEGSEFSENGGYGILASAAATLTQCKVLGNNVFGIQASDCTISNSEISGNKADGVNASFSAVISDSKIEGNGQDGLEIRAIRAPWAAITGCTISGNTEAGVLLTGQGDQWTVSRSVIRGNKNGLRLNATQPGNVDRVNLQLEGNDITANADTDLRNDGQAALVVEKENYWGDPTTAELQAHQANLTKVFDSRDDASKGQVVIRVFSTVPMASGPPPPIRGDVNGDGSVNVVDVVFGLRHLAHIITLDAPHQAAGDMDNNGTLDIRDVVALLRSLVGL